MTNFWQSLKNLLNKKQNLQAENLVCENCITIFLEDNRLLHVNNNQIKIYDSTNIKIPYKIVELKSHNLINRHILSGIQIPGTNLIAIIQVGLRMFIINFISGNVIKSIKNVNQICRFTDQSLILFGINQIRTICKRTFKVINQVTTEFSSPVFTADVQKNLIIVGSYFDIYLLDYQLQIKSTVLRAHSMSVLSVKFINSQTIVSAGEDCRLTFWKLQIEQIDDLVNYSLSSQLTIHLSHLNALNIVVCPFNQFSLLLNSNTNIRYILFNQLISKNAQIDYSQLKYKQFNVKMDKIFESERQFLVKQLHIDIINNAIIANFKDKCILYSSHFNKSMFEQLKLS